MIGRSLLNLLVTATGLGLAIYILFSLLLAPAASAARWEPAERVASHYAGAPVAIHCGGVEDGMWGVAWHERHLAYLHSDVCRGLRRLAAGRGALYSSAVGLNVLLHESAHLRGIKDERRVECMAARWFPDALRRFYGVRYSAAWARELRVASFMPRCVRAVGA